MKISLLSCAAMAAVAACAIGCAASDVSPPSTSESNLNQAHVKTALQLLPETWTTEKQERRAGLHRIATSFRIHRDVTLWQGLNGKTSDEPAANEAYFYTLTTCQQAYDNDLEVKGACASPETEWGFVTKLGTIGEVTRFGGVPRKVTMVLKARPSDWAMGHTVAPRSASFEIVPEDGTTWMNLDIMDREISFATPADGMTNQLSDPAQPFILRASLKADPIQAATR